MDIPLRVLIVEDSEDDALLLVRDLRRGGYDVTFERVETSEAMTAALDDRHWDFVFADYTMPHFSGIKALRLLRGKDLDLPYIFVSGTIGEDTAVAAMKEGANDYIVKGNLKRLFPAVERELREAESRRERRRAEEALRKSEERFKRLVESVTSYIYAVEVKNGKPVSTKHGPGCVAVTGYTPEEYEADSSLWYRMVHEEDRGAVTEQADKAHFGKSAKSLEHRIIHKDGSIHWVRNTPVHRHDDQGRVVAYDGLVTDITEQKKLEEQLYQIQKMEAIGQLAGGVAHDFNNILSVIIGYGNLMEMNMAEDNPNRIHLKEILQAGDKATHLTRSLLAFSRKQIIDPKPQSLNEIIKGIEKFLRRIIGEDIEFKTDLSGRNPTVLVDRGQMEQVLMNLAANARDAMPDGGDLIMETEILHLEEEYVRRHGYGEVGTYVILSVTDSGAGMDEKTRNRIFEPFFTTKEPGKGTGLGLSMVYGIVKQHDGYINVYSESGRGTTFKIYLPLVESAIEETVHEMPATYPEGGTETILVVEDDPIVMELTKAVLEKFGYTIIAAENGEDAIKKFMEHKDEIRLLLLDVIMPKKNGKEAYEEIKRTKPDIKAIFMSGHTANLIHKKGILDEGLDFILKPVSPKALLRKVREVLDRIL